MNLELYWPYFDVPQALARLGGNQKLYVRLLRMCQTGVELSAAEAALAGDDLASAAVAVHTVKGMTGNLSMMRLYEASDLLCQALRSGSCPSYLKAEYFAAVKKTMALLPDLLQDLVP